MLFPLMFRSDHEEVVRLLRERIDELKAQLTPPQSQVVPAPLPPPTAEQQDEFEIERQRTKARLRSIMRTKPSMMGRVMERELVRAEVEKRERAHGTHPAQVMFKAARQEA